MTGFLCGKMFFGSEQASRFALPGSKPQYAPDRVCDIKHIKLELSFDFEGRKLFGVASTTLQPINDGLKYVDFDSVELNIKRVTLGADMTLAFEQLGEKLRVYFDKPRKSDEELTVVISYEASPRRGLYFIAPDDAYPTKPFQIWSQGQDEDSRHWFPCYDYPNEKATSEVIVTVPSKYFALSNGKLVSVAEDKKQKTKTYHWKQEIPHVTYLITLTVGEFIELKDSYDGIPLLYYVPPGREEDARRSFKNTPDMIKFFSEKTGIKYPYEKYAQIAVADFIFGGMENTSATTLTDRTLHDERAHLDFSSDPLVAHELAHQWFGDLLTCKDWSHAWLNEGFATYFEALYKEHQLGIDEFRQSMLEKAEVYFKEDKERYRRPIVTRVYYEPIELFDRHLYQKGAWVLHMLRFVLGEELFWKSIRHYANKFKGQTVQTSDFINAITEATGKNLEWFFDEWIYKAGHPEFKVEYHWDEEAKQAQISVSQKQTNNELTPIFEMPVEILFKTSKNTERFRVFLHEKEQRFYFPSAEKPLMVRFDPGNWILKTLDFPVPKELLFYQLKHDEDVTGRMQAAEGLAKLGTLEVIEALKETILEDEFWGVQAAAAKALGTIHSGAARDALIGALAVKHPKARRAVVRALGEFKDELTANALLKVLEKDESYFVEAEAALALAKTKSPKAFEALQKALEKDSFDEVIRAHVFQGFGELRDARALPLALEWSKYGKPSQVRQAAVAALGKLGEGRHEVVDYLSDLLEDKDLWVRLAAIDALKELKDDRAIPALQRVIDRALDGRERRRAKEAIQKLKEGKDRSDELKKLREDLERLREENRQLRDRLDKVEAKTNKVQAPKRSNRSAARTHARHKASFRHLADV